MPYQKRRRRGRFVALVLVGILFAITVPITDRSLPGFLIAGHDFFRYFQSRQPFSKLDPQRYFDIPLGLPPLPEDFKPVSTATIEVDVTSLTRINNVLHTYSPSGRSTTK